MISERGLNRANERERELVLGKRSDLGEGAVIHVARIRTKQAL